MRLYTTSFQTMQQKKEKNHAETGRIRTGYRDHRHRVDSRPFGGYNVPVVSGIVHVVTYAHRALPQCFACLTEAWGDAQINDRLFFPYME